MNTHLNLLTAAELDKIFEASLEILETTGMKIDDKMFLNALENKGAVVDYSKSIVKFPRSLLLETTKQVAGDFEKLNLFESAEEAAAGYNWGGGPAVYYQDYESGEIRRGTEADALSIIHFADAVSEIKTVSSTMLVYSEEANGKAFHPRLWTLKTTALTAKNTSKISYSEYILSVKELDYLVQIGKILYGSLEELKKRPTFTECKTTISPLTLAHDAAEIFRYLIDGGFRCFVSTMPIAGATAPVTLAGTMALANAEMLGVWAAIKAFNPAAKCDYTVPWLSIMDMRSGTIAYGAPESLLQNIGLHELFRRYYKERPVLDSLYVDGKLPGGQGLFERSMYYGMGLTFGMKCLASFGWLDRSQLISLGQAAVDLESSAWMERFDRGIVINEESLALDIIKKVGIGGNYLAEEHTAAKFRSEYWMPDITDRGSPSQVSLEGYKENDMMRNANKRVKSILDNHEPFHLDKYKAEEIDRIVAEAEDVLLGEVLGD